MQEPTFLILTALAAGPQHGYAIITDAGRTSGGVTRLQTGTLYMALDRLCSAGLVEPDREEVAGGRLRRYYRLTDEGAALLATETERRRATAAVAAQRLSAQDIERAAALERRYRRLLRCYPPGHRQVHREEMLGVLLATARPGQRAPGARQTVNLVACGLAIRARRALSSLADESWQDALAVVSLITPAVMLIIAALDIAVAIRVAVVEHYAYPLAGPFWQTWLVSFLDGPVTVMIS